MLEHINSLNFDIVYSMFGYERYHIGILIDQIIDSYKKSLEDAK